VAQAGTGSKATRPPQAGRLFSTRSQIDLPNLVLARTFEGYCSPVFGACTSPRGDAGTSETVMSIVASLRHSAADAVPPDWLTAAPLPLTSAKSKRTRWACQAISTIGEHAANLGSGAATPAAIWSPRASLSSEPIRREDGERGSKSTTDSSALLTRLNNRTENHAAGNALTCTYVFDSAHLSHFPLRKGPREDPAAILHAMARPLSPDPPAIAPRGGSGLDENRIWTRLSGCRTRPLWPLRRPGRPAR
jgi:hypothetical protein